MGEDNYMLVDFDYPDYENDWDYETEEFPEEEE